MGDLWQGMQWLFGLDVDPRDYTLLQICMRALVVYLFGLAIVRVGENRFLGKATAFDIVLGFVLGSTLSRAINGSGPLLLTLLATALLVGLHWLFAAAALRSRRFGVLIKGRPDSLIRGGEVLRDKLRRHLLSDGDLEEALRLKAHLHDPGQVDEARYERNGEISVVPRRREPRVLEVRVEEGVQTVRLEIS